LTSILTSNKDPEGIQKGVYSIRSVLWHHHYAINSCVPNYSKIKAAEEPCVGFFWGNRGKEGAMQIVYSAKFYYLSVPWQDHVHAQIHFTSYAQTSTCTWAVMTVRASIRLTHLCTRWGVHLSAPRRWPDQLFDIREATIW